jgi:glycerate kinase
MHILVAPNAFKNALAADEAADCILTGLKKSRLKFTSENFPVGDGGDGTGALLIKRTGAKIIRSTARNPFGQKMDAMFGITDDGTAIIELAGTSGLHLFKPDELDPLHASTQGTGDLIKTALDKNATCIMLCIGGSCTVDGGTGILQALGIRFLDRHGRELPRLPATLDQLAAIDSSQLDERIKKKKLVIVCDVENKLLGENGAAFVFAPQKGAGKKDIVKLEAGLARFSDVSFHHTGINMSTLVYGGAAGGVGAGLATLLNAQLVNGAEYFLDYTHFNDALKNANLLITGEGSLDEQTLQGKAPYAVALRAKQKRIPVVALAGKISAEAENKLSQYFDMLFPINERRFDLSAALKQTPENLERTSRLLGDLLALKQV